MKIISMETKHLHPVKTIALTHIGAYSGIAGAFERLCAWATVNNLWEANPKMIGVYLDNPMDTPEEKLRSKACLEDFEDVVPGEGMEYFFISSGNYFVFQVEITMSEYSEAWEKAEEALVEKGLKWDESRLPYELYVSCAGDAQDPDAPWVVDICLPVV